MKFNSMIWLEHSKKRKIQTSVIENLNLGKVYRQLLSHESIVYYLCLDAETILFRQSIIEDLMSNPGLIESLMECLADFGSLKTLYNASLYKRASLYRIIDLLIIMEKAVITLEELARVISGYDLKSQGFVELKQTIKENISSKEYKQMKTDLKEIKYIFKQVKSATLSVSMNSGLRPVFAQVSSIQDHKIKYPKAFRKISDVLHDDPVFMDKRLTSYVPVFRIGKINYDLLEEIEFGLKEYKDKLLHFVETYERIDIMPFLSLYDEMLFYKASVDLFRDLQSADLPISRPEIVESQNYVMEIKNGYNLHLALEQIELKREKSDILSSVNVIYNSIDINKERSHFIVSGANRGGKTTFTQSIGQILLLAQLGLFVPAQKVTCSLAELLVTHFPVSEKDTKDYGRFGKECERFVEGFKQANKKTLYLLNEPFSGTSHLESLNIASQGVRALIDKEIPFIMNTHLHELYHEVIATDSMRSKLISLVTQMSGEESTYIIEEHEPLGKSFAMEIAEKYGVTFEQLTSKTSDVEAQS